MKPVVSIIIPVYNAEKFLCECLVSVASQTFRQIEIICIDDFSNDKSLDILRAFQLHDPRIKIIVNESNKGLSEVLNTGVRTSSCDYVTSVDSDDFISLEMIETLLEAIREKSYDIVACGRNDVDQQGNLLESRPLKEASIELPQGHNQAFRVCNHSFWGKIWKRSLFVDNDLYFPKGLYYQDLATVPRLLYQCRSVRRISSCHYNYRIRPGSTCNSFGQKHVMDYLKVFDVLKDFFLSQGAGGIYGAELARSFRENILWHAGNVCEQNIDKEIVAQYLRHLAIMARAYIDYDDLARSNLSAQHADIATFIAD